MKIMLFFLFFSMTFVVLAEDLSSKVMDKGKQILRDPTVGFGLAEAKAYKDPIKRPPRLSANSGAISTVKTQQTLNDPTRLRGTFREALRSLRGGNGEVSTQAQLPDVRLAAKTFSADGDKSSALLRIEDRLYFVKPGDRFSVSYDKQLHEVEVNTVNLHGVQITVFPANEVLILR